jgi:hypothetical protein
LTYLKSAKDSSPIKKGGKRLGGGQKMKTEKIAVNEGSGFSNWKDKKNSFLK